MSLIDRLKPVSLEERRLFWLAAAWFFCLLSSYYILKPVREAMGVELGVAKLPSLFLATMLTMLAALPIYNLLAARLSRRWLVIAVYQFFVICVASFSLAYLGLNQAGRIVVAQVYFVWVSVFAMWSVSLFWSVAADIFPSETAKRLFGPISAAGTVGAIGASLLASQLSGRIGVVGLWLAAGMILQISVLLGVRLESQATRLVQPAARSRGNAAAVSWTGDWRGILRELLWPIVRDLLTSPYLSGTTIYICLIALAGTTVYSLVNQQVGLAISEPAERVSFFASANLAVQLVTVVLQSQLSARLLSQWGVGRTLMILPLTYALFFLLLGWRLNLTLVTVAFVSVSSLAYGLTVPARELLFTVVDQSAKYRTKAVIDTVLFRSFDWLASMGVDLALKQQWIAGYLLGLVAVGAGWSSLGAWLGRKQQALAQPAPRNESESDRANE